MASKPLFRWAGSKTRLLPYLAAFCPRDCVRYVEPFVGSAALFFHLLPQAALLADTNPHLISTYRTVRRTPKKVAALLDLMPENDPDFFYDLRGLSHRILSPVDRAARFIYLNRYCFNGLYRTDRKGRFNVPFSGSRTGRMPTYADLRSVAVRLRTAELLRADFRKTLSRVLAGDFVYMDPPYWVPQRRIFRQYSREDFDAEAVVALSIELERLEDFRIPYVLSYGDSFPARALSKGRRAQRVRVRRNISGFASGRRDAAEVIITPRYIRPKSGGQIGART